MSDEIQAGVVGFGLAGRIFHAAVISQVPGMKLAGIVERSGDDASKLYPEVRIYRTADEMIADESIRLIVIATPNDTHYALAKQAIESGHDVVVDKPVTVSADEAENLMLLAQEKGRLLSVYHNRRWDGDFVTVKQLLSSDEVGRLVYYESRFDRWRPKPKLQGWRDNGQPGGGLLLDLGSHLVDQAVVLFGLPKAVFADVRIERDNAVMNDAFDIQLYYDGLVAKLGATHLACAPGPRFLLRGTKGTYVKYGLDPQEDALRRGEKFTSPDWGKDPEESWGKLTQDNSEAAGVEPISTRSIPTASGDYRGYYANVRDALLSRAPLAVTAKRAWQTMRTLEMANESSFGRTAIECDWSSDS